MNRQELKDAIASIRTIPELSGCLDVINRMDAAIDQSSSDSLDEAAMSMLLMSSDHTADIQHFRIISRYITRRLVVPTDVKNILSRADVKHECK